MISEKARRIRPAPTLALSAKVKQIKKAGGSVIDFGIGEPNFDTPEYIKKAAIAAINNGFTKYTAVCGIDELRAAISGKLKVDNGLDYGPDQIIVSNGAKHALTNVLLALLDKGDEVIIPAPYWTSYPEMVRLADGEPVLVDTQDFQLNTDRIEEAVTEKTKAIVINSPNNPTGAVFSENELRRVAEIAVEKGLYVISDEVYEKFIYGGRHISIASMGEEVHRRTIVINGLSKSYAMTGWRIGYAAGPKELIAATQTIQSQMTSCPNSIAQKAALAALENTDSAKRMVSELDGRRKYICKRLLEIGGIGVKEPAGAFYVFPDVSSFSSFKNSTEFAAHLLDEAGVAVVPGADFGCDKRIRISYATSMENLEEGMNRLAEFCRKVAK